MCRILGFGLMLLFCGCGPMLTGFVNGWNANQPKPNNQINQHIELESTSLDRVEICSSDFSCNFGKKCVKSQFKVNGICMQIVDEFGMRQPYVPQSKSVEIGGEPQCRFKTDCPVRFICFKGNCVK